MEKVFIVCASYRDRSGNMMSYEIVSAFFESLQEANDYVVWAAEELVKTKDWLKEADVSKDYCYSAKVLYKGGEVYSYIRVKQLLNFHPCKQG